MPEDKVCWLFILTHSIVFVQCIPVLGIKSNCQELPLKNKSLAASFNDLESMCFRESGLHLSILP